MKVMKKIATFILSVCLIVPCFGMLTYAADGQIVFSDPSTKVGETVEVTGVVRAGAAIGDANLNLTYDTEYLKFKSGDNVTESGNGQLVYEGKGSGSETELRFQMKFDVLKEGTAKIEVSSYKAWLFSDESLNCTPGSSAVTIAAGDGTAPTETNENQTSGEGTGIKVTVNGTEYTLSENFSEAEIPLGFAEDTMEYEGAQRKVVKQQSGDVYLGYLVDAQNVGKFFLYDNASSSFVPFEQITISDTAAITLLSEREDVKLPKEYQETEITLNDQVFPAWRNAEKSDYYILYAMNNQGEKTLYQYDSVDGTYQRFDAPTVEQEKKADSFLGKLTASVEKYLNYVMLGAVIVFVILVVILIIIAVKLHNRNAELDELYDEYGIDLEEEPLDIVKTAENVEEDNGESEEVKNESVEEPEAPVANEEQESVDEDIFVDEDGFEDDFIGDDDFEDDEDDFIEDDDFDDDDFDDDFADEDDFEDADYDDAELESFSQRRKKEDDKSYEDFDLDFIDLDD